MTVYVVSKLSLTSECYPKRLNPRLPGRGLRWHGHHFLLLQIQAALSLPNRLTIVISLTSLQPWPPTK